MSQNFDPYFDWEEIDQAIADDFHQALKKHRSASEAFENSEADIELAKASMIAADELEDVTLAIKRHCYKQPVMVHIADEPKMEDNSEESGPDEVLVQRCQRCKSILHYWHGGLGILTPDGPREMREDDVPWWDKGDIVAKHNHDSGIGMYEIDKDRELAKHELECVGLPNMEG